LPKEIQFYGKDPDKIAPSDKGYGFFIRGRMVLPIFSEFGDPVGFATRRPSSDPGNTWWNLSRPFKKGEHLFLLNKAREKIFKNNKIYLVEGYIDGILLFQEGLDSVCALMGTVLSPRKIGLIARYCNNICLCLDVDENDAGQKAQEKAIYTLSEFGFCDSISVIDHLEVGQDPDEYVIKQGLSDFLDGERQLQDKEIKRICKKVRLQNKK
jgi:DNA primase